MKKLILPLFLAILALAACEKKTSDSGNDIDSTAVEDDAAAKAAREQAIADSLAKDSIMKDSIMKDSVNYTYYRTADLNAFFLHGRVKQLVETITVSTEGQPYTYKNIVSFNTQGNITSFSSADERMPITRRNGHIATAGQDEFAYQSKLTYSFNGNNQLASKDDYNGHGGFTYSYRGYNAYGIPSSAVVTGSYMHMGHNTETKGTATFNYSAFDQNHNYTKCTEKEALHEFGTTYDMDIEEDVDFDENRTEITNTTRTITYYSRAEVGL